MLHGKKRTGRAVALVLSAALGLSCFGGLPAVAAGTDAFSGQSVTANRSEEGRKPPSGRRARAGPSKIRASGWGLLLNRAACG